MTIAGMYEGAYQPKRRKVRAGRACGYNCTAPLRPKMLHVPLTISYTVRSSVSRQYSEGKLVTDKKPRPGKKKNVVDCKPQRGYIQLT